MRNFEERRAEVFRRSEERIQTRRKTHMMFCYIPLLVLISIGTLTLIPTVVEDGNKDRQQESLESDCGYLQLDVLDQEGNRIQIVTGSSDLSEAAEILLFAKPRQEAALDQNDNDDSPSVDGMEDSATDTSRIVTYTLKLTDVNGIITEYILTETTLYSAETNTTVTISKEIYQALRDVLGLE